MTPVSVPDDRHMAGRLSSKMDLLCQLARRDLQKRGPPISRPKDSLSRATRMPRDTTAKLVRLSTTQIELPPRHEIGETRNLIPTKISSPSSDSAPPTNSETKAEPDARVLAIYRDSSSLPIAKEPQSPPTSGHILPFRSSSTESATVILSFAYNITPICIVRWPKNMSAACH